VGAGVVGEVTDVVLVASAAAVVALLDGASSPTGEVAGEVA
jgi:hypothetical protein